MKYDIATSMIYTPVILKYVYTDSIGFNINTTPNINDNIDNIRYLLYFILVISFILKYFIINIIPIIIEYSEKIIGNIIIKIQSTQPSSVSGKNVIWIKI